MCLPHVFCHPCHPDTTRIVVYKHSTRFFHSQFVSVRHRKKSEKPQKYEGCTGIWKNRGFNVWIFAQKKYELRGLEPISVAALESTMFPLNGQRVILVDSVAGERKKWGLWEPLATLCGKTGSVKTLAKKMDVHAKACKITTAGISAGLALGLVLAWYIKKQQQKCCGRVALTSVAGVFLNLDYQNSLQKTCSLKGYSESRAGFFDRVSRNELTEKGTLWLLVPPPSKILDQRLFSTLTEYTHAPHPDQIMRYRTRHGVLWYQSWGVGVSGMLSLLLSAECSFQCFSPVISHIQEPPEPGFCFALLGFLSGLNTPEWDANQLPRN